MSLHEGHPSRMPQNEYRLIRAPHLKAIDYTPQGGVVVFLGKEARPASEALSGDIMKGNGNGNHQEQPLQGNPVAA